MKCDKKKWKKPQLLVIDISKKTLLGNNLPGGDFTYPEDGS
jgi:hypothetical protein